VSIEKTEGINSITFVNNFRERKAANKTKIKKWIERFTNAIILGFSLVND
jgi:hypothetical protein